MGGVSGVVLLILFPFVFLSYPLIISPTNLAPCVVSLLPLPPMPLAGPGSGWSVKDYQPSAIRVIYSMSCLHHEVNVNEITFLKVNRLLIFSFVLILGPSIRINWSEKGAHYYLI